MSDPDQRGTRTTIVGGRPPEEEVRPRSTPRGIEVLLKKASVDPDFAEILLAERAGAAETIGLQLQDSERRMLEHVPEAQLRASIQRTVVAPISRAAFLGQAAAVMLAALGVEQAVAELPRPGGIRPDVDRGVRPDDFTLGIRPGPGIEGIRPEITDGIRPDPSDPDHEVDPGTPSSFVIGEYRCWRGGIELGVTDDGTFRSLQAAVEQENQALDQAFELAREDWNSDLAWHSAPFPLQEVPRSVLELHGAWSDRAAASLQLPRWREMAEKKQAAIERREQRRLESLSPEERGRAERLAQATREARDAIQRFLENSFDLPELLRRRPLFSPGRER